ncbi:hypothetical protein Tco_0975616 [Tanacetum coccineum]|uniref:Reverse transcriptase domain-containing protein n=1 Tax=Tanacetum coccineum TaxID=301880 RepID=A0ABQ5EEY0_9ASTR
MIKSSNGETPFSLTYGTKAVIPAEIGMPTLWTAEVDLTKNDEALEINLDLIEEKREQAAIQEAKSKAKMEKYYNSKVQSTSFRRGKWSIVAMMQATARTEENLALNGKDHTKLRTDHMRSWHGNKTKGSNAQDGGRQQHFSRLHLCLLHPPKSGKTEARRLSSSLVGEEPRHASWPPQHEHAHSSMRKIRSPRRPFYHRHDEWE